MTTRTISGVSLTSNSIILATLQGSAGTGCYVRYATRVSSTSFKVVFSKPTDRSVVLGWFIVN